MSIEFLKVRDVKDPVRNPDENAGIDFFIPNLSAKEVDEEGTMIIDFSESVNGRIVIPPHGDTIIPSGIKSKFPKNLALIANNKSGIATKKKLIVGATVIDCSYQGEWHFHLINTSDKPQYLDFGQKVVQFVPFVIDTDAFTVSTGSEEEFFTEHTDRGSGWAGSTGV